MGLSKQQQSEVNHQLEIRRNELLELILTRSKLVREGLSSKDEDDCLDHDEPTDGTDKAHLTDLDVLQREKAELERINEAFNRMEAGQFGTCEVCDGAIGFARLKAFPFTKCCASCQISMDQGSQPIGAQSFDNSSMH